MQLSIYKLTLLKTSKPLPETRDWRFGRGGLGWGAGGEALVALALAK
jgi:hypothetical protein